MTDYTPKSTAPAYFSLADAFIALITGDPNWGWLVDWATLVPQLGQSTAEFCAEGPIDVPDLSVVFGSNPNQRNPIARAAQYASIAASIGLIARDRVFQAYCETSVPMVGGWGPSTFLAIPVAPGGSQSTTTVYHPGGATSYRFRKFSDTCPTTSGNFNAQCYNITPGNALVGGANVGTYGCETAPTGWTTRSVVDGNRFSVNQYSTTISGVIEIQWNVAGTAEHTATPQDPPTGYVSPIGATAATLPAIAHELDVQEFKLDFLMAAVQAISGATIDLAGDVLDAVTNDPDAPVALADAAGVVISASGDLSKLTLGFGTPQEYARLGRINFGTADAWFPSVPFSHTPMVLKPLPNGATRVVVTGVPPGITVSIALIARNK